MYCLLFLAACCVFQITSQTLNKSYNNNRNPATKQHAIVSIQLNIVACPIHIQRSLYEIMLLHRFYNYPLSLSLSHCRLFRCHRAVSCDERSPLRNELMMMMMMKMCIYVCVALASSSLHALSKSALEPPPPPSPWRPQRPSVGA